MELYRTLKLDNKANGIRHGRWTFIGPSFMVRLRANYRSRIVVAVCDCGNVGVIDIREANAGKRVAGCYQCRKDKCGRIHTTHGKRRTPEYKIWHAMKSRCNTPTVWNYASYGGRGIRVCEEWSNSFQAFYEYMGPRPTNKHQIDRIDNDGNYEPGNVRWVTAESNCGNRRTSIVVEYKGEKMTLKQAAAKYGVSYGMLLSRVSQRKMSIEVAIETPCRKRRVRETQGK